MGTDSTTTPPGSQDLAPGPFSVSLKVNSTSAMLYRNGYLPRNGKEAGTSTQQFLCSFSIHKTEIPPNFHNQLKLATNGNPRRYEQLMQTLQTRVLEPARRRQQERERLEQLTCLRDWVTFAQQQIQQAKGYAYRDAHLADPQVQHRVRQLLQESQSLLIEPQAIATGTQTEPNSSQAEKTLQQLLETINQACWQIQAMVPLAGGKFGRGYTFAPETIAQVQQLWFNTSDAIGVLNQRQQLNRPSGWSQLRAQLMQPSHVEAPQPPASATEQEPPSDTTAPDGITSAEPS